MQRTNESIFIIDRLQLDCRASSAQRSAYLAISGLVIGAFTGSILALCWWTSYQFDPVCPAETRIPLWLWISVYAVWAMAMNALDLRRPPWLTTGLHRSAAARWWAASFRAVMMFVTSTIPWLLLHYLFGTRYGARAGMAPVAEACTRTATTTLRLGHRWISSGFVALVYGGTLRGETDLTPVEATGWSCRLAVPGLLYGLAIGGMSVKQVNNTMHPNQGIAPSFGNALKSAALLGGQLTVAAWPILMLEIGGDEIRQDGWQSKITIGLMAALVGFVWRVWREVILHDSLRAVPTLTHQLPLDLTGFLDHRATDLGFLRKVAGGCMFIHRYLLEHFAAGKPEGVGTPAR